jgi:hypothetical protein
MNIDAVHLAYRSTTEGAEKILRELEAELTDAKSRRDKILADISAANEASVRDQRARLALPGLNKQDAETGRLIRSIEMQVSEARKRVAMAENHAAGAAAKRGEAALADASRDKLFECLCPDGVRKVRHRAASLEALQKALQPQYRVVSEIFGANDDNTGGFAASIGSNAKSNMMDGLLQAHGDTLLAWLAKHGIASPVSQSPELAKLKELTK